MDEMLKEIKNAEEKANAIILEAGKRKDAAIKKAAEDARNLEALETEKYGEETEKKIMKEEEAIKKEGAAIMEEGRKNASKLMKRAESNMGSALSFVLKKFKETVK